MRAIWITRSGGPEVLEVRESPDPQPKPGEVRIRVAAAGLNFAEVMAQQGLYPDAPKPPCVVGYEGAGIVDAVGEGVDALHEGARVLFVCRFGAHASVVCVPSAQVLTIPDDMSFECAAALPVNYLTAHHMLLEIARVRPGDHVLVHMAAGGVGTAALQICRAVGGITTYGTCSESKHDYARAQGLDHAIDYRKVDYSEALLRLTDGQGVHYVLDALGGRDWKKGYRLLRPGGLLIAFGVANTNTNGRRNLLHVVNELIRSPWITPYGLMNDNRGYAGVNFGKLWDHIPLLRRQLEHVLAWHQQGKLAPHVGARFKFSEAGAAFEYLALGKNVGKVVLIPD